MKKLNESGRSMVEMLGVLAIIGVLSIGGISGYTMAMNRYRANEILDLATKYAAILYSSKESYKVRHGGSESGFNAPLYTETDLPAMPGASIRTTDKLNSFTQNDNVHFVIDFNDKSVCMAAASSLGYVKRTNQINPSNNQVVYDPGFEDCDNIVEGGKPSIFFKVKQS